MALDAWILTKVREWVGSTPDDASITVTYGLPGNQSPEATALSILRTRRADMLGNPAQFTVVGDYSENRGRNLDALDAQIRSLENLVGVGEDVVTTGFLSRGSQR